MRPSGGGPGTREGEMEATTIINEVSRLAQAMADGREWMDYKQAAAYLGYSEPVFKALASKGEIPRHRFSVGGWRYHAPELTEWLLQR